MKRRRLVEASTLSPWAGIWDMVRNSREWERVGKYFVLLLFSEQREATVPIEPPFVFALLRWSKQHKRRTGEKLSRAWKESAAER